MLCFHDRAPHRRCSARNKHLLLRTIWRFDFRDALDTIRAFAATAVENRTLSVVWSTRLTIAAGERWTTVVVRMSTHRASGGERNHRKKRHSSQYSSHLTSLSTTKTRPTVAATNAEPLGPTETKTCQSTKTTHFICGLSGINGIFGRTTLLIRIFFYFLPQIRDRQNKQRRRDSLRHPDCPLAPYVLAHLGANVYCQAHWDLTPTCGQLLDQEHCLRDDRPKLDRGSCEPLVSDP